MAEGAAAPDAADPAPLPAVARDKFPEAAARPRSWFPIIAMLVLMVLVIFPTVFFLLSLISKQKKDKSTVAPADNKAPGVASIWA
ncbi:uncharacterized protein LOC144130123 isoform X2 [Amblyomma americanum]